MGIQGRREAAELSSISASSRATRSGDEAVVPVNEILSTIPVTSHLCVEGAPDGMDPSSDRGVRGQPPEGQRWKAENLLEAVGRGNARANRDIGAGKVEIKIRRHKLVTNWSQRKQQCTWASASTSVDRWLERLMSV